MEGHRTINGMIPGHWERDLIKGAGNRSTVGTLIDRSMLFLMLGRSMAVRL